MPPLLLGLSCIADTSDGIRPIISHEEGVVVSHGQPHRASPNFAIRRDETVQKIFIRSGCAAILNRATRWQGVQQAAVDYQQGRVA